MELGIYPTQNVLASLDHFIDVQTWRAQQSSNKMPGTHT